MNNPFAGAVFGVVVTSDNQPLPGVTVIAGVSGDKSTITAGKGEYKFAGLPPGNYTLTFKMPGFSTVKKSLVVQAGQTDKLRTVMNPSPLKSGL